VVVQAEPEVGMALRAPRAIAQQRGDEQREAAGDQASASAQIVRAQFQA
jgi:hypothetical protein